MPADTAVKGLADRVLSHTGVWIVVIASIIALLNIAPHLSKSGDLAIVGAAALLGGGICSANFWRCRHAHCMITGPAWLALSALAFAEAGIGHSLIGGREQTVFLATLALSLVFECSWHAVRGTKAVVSGRVPT